MYLYSSITHIQLPKKEMPLTHMHTGVYTHQITYRLSENGIIYQQQKTPTQNTQKIMFNMKS